MPPPRSLDALAVLIIYVRVTVRVALALLKMRLPVGSVDNLTADLMGDFLRATPSGGARINGETFAERVESIGKIYGKLLSASLGTALKSKVTFAGWGENWPADWFALVVAITGDLPNGGDITLPEIDRRVKKDPRLLAAVAKLG